jgi:hypothetical protein
VRGENDWGTVLTGRQQWRTAAARVEMRVRARSDRGEYMGAEGRLGGRGVNHVADARAAWAARRCDHYKVFPLLQQIP